MKLDETILSEIGKKEYLSLVIESELLMATIDNRLAKTLNDKKGKEIVLSFKKLANEEKIKTLDHINGIKEVYDINILINNEKVNDLEEGLFTISIPYKLEKEQDSKYLKVYHILSEDKLEEIKDFKYDEENHRITFDVKSLSYFVINYSEESEEKESEIKKYIFTFTDVNKNHYAYKHIYSLAEKGIINGVSATHFEPERNITRAEFTTILAKMSGDKLEYRITPFTDVKEETWYAPVISWAYENNIIYGKTETLFSPDDNITREEMATMLKRYMDVKELDIIKTLETPKYTDDNEISMFAKEAVYYMTMKDLLKGRGDNKFDPKASATRAEAVTMINRMIEELER